jgi:excisionase family DNA binding protein
MQITFEQLPQTMFLVLQSLERLERLLAEKEKSSIPPTDEPLTVEEAAKFLRLKKPTVYTLVSKGELPVLKRSKRNYFLKEDLINYLKAGRKKTLDEIANEADTYLTRKKKATRKEDN